MPSARSLTIRGHSYVPAYAVVPGHLEQPANLATMLRIDNTSSVKPIIIERIDYFDTSGKLVRRFLDAPIALKPFGALQIHIAAEDNRGGPAANFVVTWAGNGPIAEPLIETVMFGAVGPATYSFVSQGRRIRTVGKRQWFSLGPSR